VYWLLKFLSQVDFELLATSIGDLGAIIATVSLGVA